jgi:hypothetical protein
MKKTLFILGGNMKRSKFFKALINSMLVSTIAAGSAYAANCTASITAPCTIAAPGVYKLTSNITVNTTNPSAVIVVNASNVVVDLAGFEIKNTKTGYGDGIAYNGTKGILDDITVKNGRIVGFNSGVIFHNNAASGDNIVTNALVEGITVLHSAGGFGITNDGDTGINLDGRNITIRNCIVDSNNSGETASIKTLGSNIHIVNNDIFNPGNRSGILYYGDNGTIIENNRLSTIKIGVGTGMSVGIENAIVSNNRFVNFSTGIEFGGAGIYRDNIFIGVANPVSGGFDAGNNKSF